jgi:hypothetical protein
MSYYVWRGHNETENKTLLDGFFRINLKLTSDFACMVMTDAMQGGGVISSQDAASKLFYHPMYKEWATLHGAALKKRYAY